MLTPRKIGLIISISASLIAGCALALFIGLEQEDIIKYIAAAIIAIFIIVYVLTNYVISSFIAKKLTPIYKTIWSKDVNQDMVSDMVDNEDLFTDLQKEVTEWSADKPGDVGSLRKQAQYRKEFMGNVSHELKTPIFNIQGYVQTLLEGGIDDSEVNIKYLEKADKSISRMISIVEDLESISKLESGELQLKYDNFDITQLITEIFEAQEMRAQKKNISLKFTQAADKPLMVFADRTQIWHVLSNLIVNSINYGIDNGNTTINYYDMDENVMVEVSDNGIGISKDDITRLFERFYRVDKSRSRVAGGTGLGLAIVKHIIDAHNQNINVTSELYEGTTFTFTLKKSS